MIRRPTRFTRTDTLFPVTTRFRSTGSLEIYQIDTKYLLLSQGIPSSTGYGSVLSNIGATRNNGYELTLSTVNVATDGGFRWTSNINVAINRNKIVDLYGDKTDDVGDRKSVV